MFRQYYALLFVIFIYLSFAGGATVSAQSNSPEAVSATTQKTLKKGYSLSRKGKNEKATRLYEKALSKTSLSEIDRDALKKKLADRYTYVGRGVDAIELMTDVNLNEKRDQRLLRDLVKEAIAHERYPTALDWLERFGSGYQENSYHDYRTRVVIYGLMERMDDVKREIKSYAEERPNDVLVKDVYAASLKTQNREVIKVANGGYPIMPHEAERSGHCVFSVSVGASGKVTEILETNCTEAVFEPSSRNVVKGYIYLPKLVNGTAVQSIDKGVKVSFRLMGTDGKIIPEYNSIEE